MRKSIWISMLALVSILVVGMVDDAAAQRRGGSSSTPPPPSTGGFSPFMEVSLTYGSMWGGNIPFSYSYYSPTMRTGTGPSYGIALDYNVHPMQAVELSYTKQDGSLDLDYKGIRTLTDMSVNFWQIGTIRYVTPPGKMRPFVLASLGATYFSPSSSTIQIDSEDPDSVLNTRTVTKFSMNLGLGFKAYFGEAEKIGLRATFKVMPTMYNSWSGIYVGSGGGGVSVSGNAIWQWEAAGGITIKFGT